jgi:hypothetical protein
MEEQQPEILTNEERERHMKVVRAAWEIVLRGTSTTIRWGTFSERVRALRAALDGIGNPKECGVEEPEMVYDWRAPIY